jgi:hypothetical protein
LSARLSTEDKTRRARAAEQHLVDIPAGAEPTAPCPVTPGEPGHPGVHRAHRRRAARRSRDDALAAPRQGPADPRGPSSWVARTRATSGSSRTHVAARQGRGGGGGGRGGPPGPPPQRTGPTPCHDITVYPSIGLAGGACGGYGLLLDISDVANPRRLFAAADSNFSFWHSATFANDGSKVLFTDEWGGGGQPRCRDTDPYEWGADAIFTIDRDRLTFHSYFKMPAAQTPLENCVDTTARSFRSPDGTSWCRPGIRASSMSSTGATRTTPSRSRTSTAAQRLPVPERDRRREDGMVRVLQRAGAARDRLAAELRARPCLRRPARAGRWPRDGPDRLDTRGALTGGGNERPAASDRAARPGLRPRRSRPRGGRPGEGPRSRRRRSGVGTGA